MLSDGACAVSLPGGVFSEEGRLLRKVELRPVTGGEEEWLARSASAPAAHVVSRLLSACLVRVGDGAAKADLAGSLLVGDRDYLMLQLRRMTLGNRLRAVVVCPACAVRMDVEFDVDEVPVERPAEIAAAYEVRSGGRRVRFRLPIGADQEAVAAMPLDAAVDALLARCTLDDGGGALSAEEREAVVTAMEQAAPRVELDLDLTCPECSYQFAMPFDTSSFFLDEMRIRGDLLLREIHAIAFYYHWTEGEILRLPRDRRRAYLSLLSDAVRSE